MSTNDSVSLARLVAGAELAGTSYPEAAVEGQVFFLIEETEEEEV